MRAVVLLLSILLAAPSLAQNSGVDRAFGRNGILSLRDPAQPLADVHTGIAACAAPGGGLTVASLSQTQRLTLFRIDADGELDPRFGEGGIATVAFPLVLHNDVQGACMADGRIVVAGQGPGLGADRNAQLLRLLPEGRLDPTFANGGALTVDFDRHVLDLGDGESPVGLNLDASGNILLSMRLFLPDGNSRPGLASLDATGAVRFARLYAPPGVDAQYASLAGLGPNGRLWLVGGGYPAGLPVTSWFRAELDPVDGTLLATQVSGDGTANYVVDGGRVLPSGVMVAAGKYVPQNEPGGAYRPRLFVFRTSGFSAVALPAPAPVNSFAPTLSPFIGRGVAIPIAGDRVLMGSPLGAQNGEWHLATYAAVVELGASAAQDRVDTRFGQGGATQFAYRTPTACANGSPPPQRPVRFSNWRGRPVLAGSHTTECNGARVDAFAARLLLPTDIVRDSFEQ